jgi:hypothetical protein
MYWAWHRQEVLVLGKGLKETPGLVGQATQVMPLAAT